MLAIYKKELRSYFTSMIGYVFISLFLAIIGVYFYIYNLVNRAANFEYTVANVSFIFVLLVPLLTMRIMAEENRQKTDQLLLTSPVTAADIVLGKFFAVFTILFMVVAVISTYPLIMSRFGEVPYASAYASLFGFLLLGGAYLAMGLYLSSLTESQVVAAVITFIVFFITLFMDNIAKSISTGSKSAFIFFTVLILIICFILWLMMHNLTVSVGTAVVGEGILLAIYLSKPALLEGSVIKVFNWLSANARFYNFYMGIFDLSDIIYYLSIIIIFLFLSIQVIKKKRWS
ncbi:ABC-2 type transport system permease protein [Herbinix hemicellulosilytica]|uniref:Putative membrane protein n=1 Tax=Herbinix hemicellulosilytica TaxID=1564487 RepID=A0A0H5SEV6_HERHM|nr:ABC transporter permease [Herbinix hemicellulosilytica]RBP56931.1 ABC-2 type transport system permease protein [Herbinix hemicellulosilytica]CRZ33381.1 putative membrane protein [Herbinix hemicellulosilytica]